jgi:exodeoxyribonuclease V alpha subunit
VSSDGSVTAGGSVAPLQRFVDAGVLTVADLRIAQTLGRLAEEHTAAVLLAAALAVRAPRLGHVCVELSSVADTVTADGADPIDADLPWPEPSAWRAVLATSPLVAESRIADRPLVLDGDRLYLERYWHFEQQVARGLAERASVSTPVPAGAGGGVVDDPGQAAAIHRALGGLLTVIAGGPGTGKTTTVARMLDDLVAGHVGPGAPRVALVAPTGKAGARLEEALRGAKATVTPAFTGTIHRLLGRTPGSNSAFRHDARDPIPYDVLVVDETSMVSLPLMARLLDAVPPTARLVLVGDQHQLASVEAGAVLGDIVAAAGPGLDHGALAGRISLLTTTHRFGHVPRLAELADAVRAGDADLAVEILDEFAGEDPADAPHGLTWIREPIGSDAPPALRAHVVAPARAAAEAARAHDPDRALGALGSLRVLCAHRRGLSGVEGWNRRIERWLAEELGALRGWYPGRPVLVTRNDYRNGLFNGDMGIVVSDEERPEVAFPGSVETGTRLVAAARLADVETVHAMTIHKSQGSEFTSVVVVLPPDGSRLLTRELVYTGISRARDHLTLVADEASLRAAIARPARRSTGLGERLA